MSHSEERRVVWVRTTPAPDGTYRPVLEADDDTADDLGDGRAAQHAHAVLTAVAHAESDAAVMRQMGHHLSDVGRQRAAEMVQLLRERRARRAPITWPTALSLTPGVSAFTGAPFLHVRIRGRLVGQWTLPDARDHAAAVIEATAGAQLDTDYLAVLLDLDVPREEALAVVGDLAQHRADNTTGGGGT